MTSPSPETPGQSTPRRLRRSADDRRVAGVAGGMAEAFGLDAALVRIAFVVLAFFGGAGLAAYVIAAFVIPDAEGAPLLTTRATVVLAVLAIAAVVSAPVAAFFLVPAALGVLVWRALGGSVPGGLLRASVVVVVTVSAAAVGLAAGAAAAFGAGTAVAVLVIVTGVALVAGGVRGGARWLILPALLLTVPVSAVSAADLELQGGVGERQYRPATVSEIRPSYELGVGELEIDLRDVDFSDVRTATLEARVGVGSVEVTVPGGVCVRATAEAGLGEINLLGRVNDGVDVNGSVGGEAGTPTVEIVLEASAGELVVRRAPSEAFMDEDFVARNPQADGCA